MVLDKAICQKKWFTRTTLIVAIYLFHGNTNTIVVTSTKWTIFCPCSSFWTTSTRFSTSAPWWPAIPGTVNWNIHIQIKKMVLDIAICWKKCDLPGQHWLLQSVCSTASPLHAAPPHSASCLFLILSLVPPPQDLVQVLHACQVSHEQSTEIFFCNKLY